MKNKKRRAGFAVIAVMAVAAVLWSVCTYSNLQIDPKIISDEKLMLLAENWERLVESRLCGWLNWESTGDPIITWNDMQSDYNERGDSLLLSYSGDHLWMEIRERSGAETIVEMSATPTNIFEHIRAFMNGEWGERGWSLLPHDLYEVTYRIDSPWCEIYFVDVASDGTAEAVEQILTVMTAVASVEE